MAFNTGWIVSLESPRDTARMLAAIDVPVELLAPHKALFSGKTKSSRGSRKNILSIGFF